MKNGMQQARSADGRGAMMRPPRITYTQRRRLWGLIEEWGRAFARCERYGDDTDQHGEPTDAARTAVNDERSARRKMSRYLDTLAGTRAWTAGYDD
jgi:hypothetical protein